MQDEVPGTHVLVEGLNYDVLDDDIRELFEGVGELKSCEVRPYLSAVSRTRLDFFFSPFLDVFPPTFPSDFRQTLNRLCSWHHVALPPPPPRVLLSLFSVLVLSPLQVAAVCLSGVAHDVSTNTRLYVYTHHAAQGVICELSSSVSLFLVHPNRII